MNTNSQMIDFERFNLSHRLPFSFPYYDNTHEIEEEIRSHSIDIQNLFDQIKLFFIVPYKPLLEKTNLKVIEFLTGEVSLDNLNLTKENALLYLKITKVSDLALIWQTRISRTKILFKNTSYSIRTRILELLSPEMTTTEAYTYTIDSKKLKNVDYLKNPLNWIPERLGFYSKLISSEYIQAIALSKRLNEEKPRIYAMKGLTASGKSTFAKQRIAKGLDEKGKISGCINPDTLKFILKSKSSLRHRFTNIQVHEEVARGPLSHYKKALLNLSGCSIILDTRLSSQEDVEEVIAAAKAKKKMVTIFDIDVPLMTSMKRVLTNREPLGEEPCVRPSAIIDGFIETRKCRNGIIQRIKEEVVVDHYELLRVRKEIDFEIIAEKRSSKFSLFSKKFLGLTTKAPSEEDINESFSQILNEGPWSGFSIGNALEYHSSGLLISQARFRLKQDKILLKQFGGVRVFPFTNSWLIDYPQIKKHLETEHLLHVRGCDENGFGLHWQTNKFAWKFNPNFNPESKGGFQMKLGYFIIPSQKAKTLISKSLSPHILKEIEVKSSLGIVLGYRFFVHPEAYSHFQVLHECGIYYVKPDQSEFIGTPTSSYRSWALRHIVEDDNDINALPGSIPFIVKLGVPTFEDNSRQLSENEVYKSIDTQDFYDGLEGNDHLLIFPETFGMILQNIPNYPPKTNVSQVEAVNSGMIIREFPKELLDDKCQIYSFSALMSAERMNHENWGIQSLPLIYEIIENTIQKGSVSSSLEFIKKYLIEDVIKSLETIVFKQGMSLPLHGQNLCLVLDQNHIPKGIAIRDHGDVNKVKHYIETFSWFYRYHVFIKLMNVITFSNTYYLPPLPGLPVQKGCNLPLEERSINFYLQKKMKANPIATNALKNLSITFADYIYLIKMLDHNYLKLICKYFDVEKCEIDFSHLIPSAEVGSVGEKELMKLNRRLLDKGYGFNFVQ